MAGPGNSINETTTGITGFTGTAFTGTAVTNHAVLVGGATSSTLTNLSVGATGTVLAGSTGADPAFTATPSVTSITLSSGTALSTYVQGTWTPNLQFGGASVGLTYTTQKGEYTQIGNIVFINADIQINAVGSSTGTVTITGLPVTSVQTNSGVCNILLSQSNIVSSGTTTLCFNTGAGTTTLTGNISSTATGGNSTMTTSNTTFSNGSLFRMAGFYFTS